MQSLFVRSLALASSSEAHCVVDASRTTSDGTFAVASLTDGIIRVYAASCAALLHEFTTIHRRIYALHYTSFSDSLVTLESDALGNDEDDEMVETFLCVYHDWRERKMVRGYTLPLGVLENPTSKKKSDCVAVCSFTGRVVVAMGTVLNIWQCSAGFFEHVMEIKVDMSQQHAYLSVEYVAIHGVYIAYASQTEVRVMEIHVRNTKESTNPRAPTHYKPSITNNAEANGMFLASASHSSLAAGEEEKFGLPGDSINCASLQNVEDLNNFIEIPVPSPAYNKMENEKQFHQQQNHQEIIEEQDISSVPVVLRRSEAQQEVWHLAGLVRDQDIRVNQALSYYVAENDVTVLLRRFLPPNNSIQSLKFLPETIDNRICIESRSYTRLLVGTEQHAFLYYFLSTEVDSTRKKMSRKVLGKKENTVSHSTRHTRLPIKMVSPRKKYLAEKEDDETEGVTSDSEEENENETTGRVVMHYHFHVPATSITANSSFLFVSTLTGLQVWSIWSPCHHVAASRALSHSLVPKPTQPQLLCVHPLPFPAADIAALDTYVILLPLSTQRANTHQGTNLLRIARNMAEDNLPADCLEMRSSQNHNLRFVHGVGEEEDQTSEDEEEEQMHGKLDKSILILQQSPPSLIFSYARQTILKRLPEGESEAVISENHVDLLLSLFSLYRYRADVGQSLLREPQEDQDEDEEEQSKSVERKLLNGSFGMDSKEYLALELETKLYDSLAKECAADLAIIFLASAHRNLKRAALLFAASNIPAEEILKKFQHLLKQEPTNSKEVMDAIEKFLEAFLFPTSSSSSTCGTAADGCVIGRTKSAFISSSSSSSSSSKTKRDTQSFTRSVLHHYAEHSPKKIAHLVIDSSLEWTLEDMQFALEQLQESAKDVDVMDHAAFVSIEVAILVLLLRANSVYTTRTSPSSAGKSKTLESLCSYANVRQQAEKLLANHQESLLELCVHHSELLALSATDMTTSDTEKQQVPLSGNGNKKKSKRKQNGSTNSAAIKKDTPVNPVTVTTSQQSVLAKALLEIAPTSFEMLIERIFHQSLLFRQESLLATVVYCLSMFGDQGKASAYRIMKFRSISIANSKTKQPAPAEITATFGLDQLSLLRFLWFLLSLFPTLEVWMERDDIQEEEEELRVIEEAIAMECIHLVIESCNHFSTPNTSSSPTSKRLEILFGELLGQMEDPSIGKNEVSRGSSVLQHLALADWIKEFIEERCIHSSVTPNIRHILRYLFYQSLLLVDREPVLVTPFKILERYDTIVSSSDSDSTEKKNDLALVMVLVSLPKCHRTIDGLNLIAKRAASCSHLFLPYGQCFCQTLEEWRFLIEILTTMSFNSGKEKEEQVLESILNHVCSTLGPEDLLKVLPDQGDLALYIATLENSVRLEETKQSTAQTQEKTEEENLFL